MPYRAMVVVMVIALVLLTGLAGCESIQETVERVKPEVRSTTLEWGEVTPQGAEVTTTMVVYNPSPISLPVKRVAFNISLDDLPMGSAETLGLHIEKNAEFPVKISARIDNTRIPAFWAEHLRRNEQSEALIEIETTFDLGITDFTFPFRLRRPITTDLLAPINKLAPTPIEKVVTIPGTDRKVTAFKVMVESVSAEWGTITDESTDVDLTAVVRNDNPYPLPLPTIAYDVDIGGLPLAAGEADLGMVIAPNAEKEVTTTITLDTSHMGEWFAGHILGGEKSKFNVKVSLVFELPSQAADWLGQKRLVVPVWQGEGAFDTNILGIR